MSPCPVLYRLAEALSPGVWFPVSMSLSAKLLRRLLSYQVSTHQSLSRVSFYLRRVPEVRFGDGPPGLTFHRRQGAVSFTLRRDRRKDLRTSHPYGVEPTSVSATTHTLVSHWYNLLFVDRHVTSRNLPSTYLRLD